jgi:flagellar assembly protein FliH
MSIFAHLEEFTTQEEADGANSVAEDQVLLGEELRLSIFEEGYQAGWEDAAKALAEDQGRISAEFAQKFQDISFGFVEARTHILAQLKPILTDLVGVFLPKLVQETLALHVISMTEDALGNAANAPINFVMNPKNAAFMKDLLETKSGFPNSVSSDPTLGPAQVLLKSGNSHHQLDLSAALTEAKTIVQAYFTEVERTHHG